MIKQSPNNNHLFVSHRSWQVNHKVTLKQVDEKNELGYNICQL